MKRLFYRIYQKVFKLVMPFLRIKIPTLISGDDASNQVGEILKGHHKKRVIIVTDQNLVKLNLLQSLINGIRKQDIEYYVYDQVTPDPTIHQIEEALIFYHEKKIDSIVAFGGGSPMDLAKALGARVARPKKKIPKLKGVLKVRKRIPLLIAIPTTVGTGSEATLAAVVTNSETQEKYAINDPVLVPSYAILDSKVVKKLPKHIIATTGMDALTHAIEAYIGKSNTKLTRKNALSASKRIFNNIYLAYQNDEEAIKEMQIAAYEAGIAFTRAYVGNIHAIAHTLGGFYHVPHGYANAVIMPHVLRYYGKKIYQKLAEISDYCYLMEHYKTDEEKALNLIGLIEDLNQKMEIPKGFNDLIKPAHLSQMISRASLEANPLYPVPVIFNYQDFRNIYLEINQ